MGHLPRDAFTPITCFKDKCIVSEFPGLWTHPNLTMLAVDYSTGFAEKLFLLPLDITLRGCFLFFSLISSNYLAVCSSEAP